MMIASLRKLFRGSKPVEEYDGKKWDLHRGCPDCGGTEILLGPEGGMCQNICCANPQCRSAFNHAGISNFLERIGNHAFRGAFPEYPNESEAYLKALNGTD